MPGVPNVKVSLVLPAPHRTDPRRAEAAGGVGDLRGPVVVDASVRPRVGAGGVHQHRGEVLAVDRHP